MVEAGCVHPRGLNPSFANALNWATTEHANVVAAVLTLPQAERRTSLLTSLRGASVKCSIIQRSSRPSRTLRFLGA